MQKVLDWIRRHPAETGLFGGIALIAIVLGVLTSSDSEPSASPAIVPTTLFVSQPGADPSSTVPADPFDESEHPDFEPIPCSGLLTLEDGDFAFGMEGQLASILEFSGGETCTEVLADDERFSVRVEPGNPVDFARGAMLEGSIGVPIAGVGEDSLWFGGADVGVIAVYQGIEDAGLYFRIRLSRPDTGPEEEREVLTELALRALPRFPGVVLTQPESEPITFEDEPADPASFSYAGNLQAKIDDGEWTLGEGLVATLQLLAGEADAPDVLRYPTLPTFDHSVLIDLAIAYVAAATADDPGVGEIVRLLTQITPPLESLEGAGDIDEQQPAAVASFVSAGSFSAGFASTDLFVRQGDDPALEGFCQSAFGTSPCLDETVVDAPGGEVTVYSVKPEFDDGWSAEQIELVKGGITEASGKFSQIAQLPTTAIFLSPVEAGLVVRPEGDGYLITLGVDMIEVGELKHVVGGALAKAMVQAKYGETAWWNEGLTFYLLGEFYDLDVASAVVSQLEPGGLPPSFMDWGPATWIFFEYLDTQLGGTGNVFNVDLNDLDQIGPLFHDFAQALSQGDVGDLGIFDEFIAQFWDLPIDFLLTAQLAPLAWGMRRIRLMVPPGKHACVDIITSSNVQVSWQDDPGERGFRAPWESEVPAGIEGNSTLLITSTGPGFLDFAITRFVDNPAECEEPPDPPPDGPTPRGPGCDVFCDPSGFYWNPDAIHSR